MLSVPQGLTEQQFAELSAKVRAGAAHLGHDGYVHGSRASGTAGPASDLDLAIRVSPERFEQFLAEQFGTPNPGSARARTMQHARETGKIQAGEAGFRSLRKSLETALGMEVDLSVIRQGGPFDQGPYLPLQGK
jgi:nucleotidyltransferase-like protein